MINKIVIGLKLFWVGFTHPELFTEHIFVMFANMFELAIKTITDEKPYCTHLMMGSKRVVSFWMYPGLSKNPVDRISELVSEIDALKGVIENIKKEIKNEKKP